MFIDIHCHLDALFEAVKNKDLVIKRAREKNVEVIVTNGVNFESNRKAIDLSRKYPEVKVCLGVYPIEALKMSDKNLVDELRFIKQNRKLIIGIGEIGLDYKEDTKKHDKQKEVFQKFINLSKELDMPLTIHSRKAELECIEILEEAKAKKVIMHYFSGKLTLIERIFKNGWFLSIPTAVKHSEHFQKVTEKVPIESLFCETDSPFSHPDKKFPNEPAKVIESYKKIAEIKGISLKEAEKKIEGNFKKLFGR